MTDTQTPAAPSAPQPGAPPRAPIAPGSRKNNPARVILAVIIGVVIIAVAIGFTDSVGESEASILKEAFEKTLDQESTTVSGNVRVNGAADQDGEAQEVDLDITFSTTVVSVSAEPRLNQGSLQVDGVVAGSEVKVEAEYRRLPPRTYFLLGSQSIIKGLPFDISGLTGQWLYADDPEEGDEQIIALPLPIDLPCQPDILAVEAYMRLLDPQDVFSRIVKKGSIDVIEPDGDKESATLYSIAVDEEKVKQIQAHAREIGGCDGLPEASDMRVESFEVAIGNTSGIIRSVNISGSAQGENAVSFSAQLLFSDFGEPPSMSFPPEARSLEEAMTEIIFGDMFGGLMEEGTSGEEMMMFDNTIETQFGTQE